MVQAVTESKPAIASAIVEAYSEVSGGGEAFAAAEANVGAIGTAIAKAYASAEIELSVEGNGYASAVAESNAEALAESFAQVGSLFRIGGDREFDVEIGFVLKKNLV